MALTIKHAKANPTWYVPDFSNNRAVAAASPTEAFMVELTSMTSGEYEALRQAESAGKLAHQLDFVGSTKSMRNAVISARVTGVRNGSIELDTGETLTPTNGSQLVDMILRYGDREHEELLDDIAAAITNRSQLAEGMAKK